MNNLKIFSTKNKKLRGDYIEYANNPHTDPAIYFDEPAKTNKNEQKISILMAILELEFKDFELLKLIIQPQIKIKNLLSIYNIKKSALSAKLTKFKTKYPNFAFLINLLKTRSEK